MIQNNFQKYKHILFAVLLIATAVSLAALFFSSRNDGGDNTTQIPSFNMDARRVFIKDFHRIVGDDSHSERDGETIQHTLYTYVSQGEPGLYTGTIRPGTIKTIGTNKKELLVDIEPRKVTYLVTLLHTDHSGFMPLSAKCAAKEYQLNPGAECKDWNNL